MLEIYRQMEADGKIGPLMPPDATGIRQQRPYAEYPKMLKPPTYERQEKLEPGPGGSALRLWQYVQTAPAVVARSRREELEFLQDGTIEDVPVGTDAVVAERDALRMQNEDLTRRLERLESLLLAHGTAASVAAAAMAAVSPTRAAETVASADALAKLAGIGNKETANG